MNKIEIYFHQFEYNKAMDKLKKKGEALSTARELIKEITNGEVDKLSLSECEAWIQKESGFQNVLKAAELMDKGDQYQKLLELFRETSSFNDTDHYYKSGKYEVSKQAEKDTREAYTQYLPKELEGKYLKLMEAVKVLNEVGRGSLKAIEPTTDPKEIYKINPFKLSFV